MFRTNDGRTQFINKYARYGGQTWELKAKDVVMDTSGRGVHGQYPHDLLSKSDQRDLEHFIAMGYFFPGGRYLYYSGRLAQFFNNCFLLRAEFDTREEWAAYLQRATSCLMTGGGIGGDYSIIRPRGRVLSRTGGVSSGPVPLIRAVDAVGAQVKQGGGRRSAIYASLNWQHDDALEFLTAKDWDNQKLGTSGLTVGELKRHDFSFHAPLEHTNVSLNYDDAWLDAPARECVPMFMKNVELAMRNGEPGFSFNFRDKQNETLRNACTEVVSEDDSDVCNLGSVNLSRIPDIPTLSAVVSLASKMLVNGTIRADLPYDKVSQVREKNRRLGLGIMGVHEWLLARGKKYGPDDELAQWLNVWKDVSERAANEQCDRFFISRPVAYRAIAPTGTIGMLAGTTTGIEPLYAVAYQRRYFAGEIRKRKFMVDATAKTLIDTLGVDPDSIETATDLARDPERRIAFLAWVQQWVDQAISSTLNLPAWGSDDNNEDTVPKMADIISKYAPHIRGLTFYPDGARGGQPIVKVSYKEAMDAGDAEYEDTSEFACKEGVCGI